MSQLILSPTSTSIYATLSGFQISTTVTRVIQFFKNDSLTPATEILVPVNTGNPQYSHTFANLKTGETYSISVQVIEYEQETVLEEYEEKATCGGTQKDPMFNITDITSNSAKIEIYRGSPSYSYYRLYAYDTADNEAIFTEWLKPDSYPKQLVDLTSNTTYKVNVGYGNIYGGGVTWIGTQVFTTTKEFDSGHSDSGAFTMPDTDISRNVIGTKANSLKSSSFTDEFTRVTITTKDDESNDEIAYSVGNDNGLELTLSCPWLANNEHDAIKIATYVLSTVSTYKYSPYTATEVLVDPAAELGDLISFETLTSEIVNLEINYESLFNADISAPTSNETEHEFPQGSTSKDSTKRYVDGMRAALEVELDKITAMVEDNNGRFQKLQITLNGVIIQNENGQTVINGANIATGTIELSTQLYGSGTLGDKISSMDSSISGKASTSAVHNYIISDLRTKFNIEQGGTSADPYSVLTSAYIYSPNLIAGDLTTNAVISELGLYFGTYNTTTESQDHNYARIGYDEVTSGSTVTARLPVLTLGQGTGVEGCGLLRKYYNGLWSGENFTDNHQNFSPSQAGSNVGVFMDFGSDSIVLNNCSWGPSSARPDPSAVMEGTIYISTD